jgi:hypothetical protein
MNKLITISILLLACFSVKGQTLPYIVDKTTFDFGVIQYKSSGTFEFTIWNYPESEEDSPVKVIDIKGCCPCKIVGSTNSEKVINRGDSAIIRCQYDTRRIGPINKSIRVNLSSPLHIKENVLHLKIIGKVAKPDSVLNSKQSTPNTCVFNDESIELLPYKKNPEKLMVCQNLPIESPENGIKKLIPFIDSLGFKIESTFYIPDDELYFIFSADSITYHQYENDTISEERFNDFSNGHNTNSANQISTSNLPRTIIKVIVKKKNNPNSHYFIISTKNGKPINSLKKGTIKALRSNQFLSAGPILKTSANKMYLNYFLWGFDSQLKLNFKNDITDDRIAIIMKENDLNIIRKCRPLKTNDKCYLVSHDSNITYEFADLIKILNQYRSLQITVNGLVQTSDNQTNE